MKVKDIVAKTTFVVLVATEKEDKVKCDSVGFLGKYEDYKNATIKSMYPFHTRSGLYKEGIVCIVKEKKQNDK